MYLRYALVFVTAWLLGASASTAAYGQEFDASLYHANSAYLQLQLLPKDEWVTMTNVDFRIEFEKRGGDKLQKTFHFTDREFLPFVSGYIKRIRYFEHNVHDATKASVVYVEFEVPPAGSKADDLTGRADRKLPPPTEHRVRRSSPSRRASPLQLVGPAPPGQIPRIVAEDAPLVAVPPLQVQPEKEPAAAPEAQRRKRPPRGDDRARRFDFGFNGVFEVVFDGGAGTLFIQYPKAVYVREDGGKHDVELRPRGRELAFTVRGLGRHRGSSQGDQHFSAYLMTQKRNAMAGFTEFDGKRFGFYAIRKSRQVDEE